MAKKSILMWILGILALIGGLVHVLQPLGFDILTYIPLASWIQFIAGVAIVWFSIARFKK